MMKKAKISLLLLMAFMAAGVQSAFAQGDSRDYERGWYAGLSGGTSFGQATFRSITESKTNIGDQFGVFGGYQFSRLFSVEALASCQSDDEATAGFRPDTRRRTGVGSSLPVIIARHNDAARKSS